LRRIRTVNLSKFW